MLLKKGKVITHIPRRYRVCDELKMLLEKNRFLL